MERSVEQLQDAWARLQVDVNCGLRRGAWYPVLRITRENAVLEVTREPLPVPRRYLQTISSRPFRWTVVPRPRDAANLPSEWGSRYAVCPVCRHRAPIGGRPVEMRCPRCNGTFQVAWDERYLPQPQRRSKT